MNKIINVAGGNHPKARIEEINTEGSYFVFAWLRADGVQVDSGGSRAKFLPESPPEADADFEELIVDPLPEATSDVVLTPLQLISRLTDEEKIAIFTSENPAVIIWRTFAVAAQEVRTDDPRTHDGLAFLVSAGLLDSDRPAQLLAP